MYLQNQTINQYQQKVQIKFKKKDKIVCLKKRLRRIKINNQIKNKNKDQKLKENLKITCYKMVKRINKWNNNKLFKILNLFLHNNICK